MAASLLTAIYHMLKTGTVHHDLGADHFDRRSVESRPSVSSRRLSRRLSGPPRTRRNSSCMTEIREPFSSSEQAIRLSA